MTEKRITMSVMAKKPKTKAKPFTIRVDAELLNRAIRFADSYEYPPDITSVMETALREYLDRKEKRPSPKP